jgi:hypothetical protein
MQGFQQTADADQLKIQVIVKRLNPAVTRRDEWAIAQGIDKMTERYGKALVSEAIGELCQAHPWMFQSAIDNLPPDQKNLFQDEAVAIMAETLTDAGLRIEDHMRLCDQGIGLTKQAIAAIVATGFPNAAELGEGNESMEGLGLAREPFWHRLSNFEGQGERTMMNNWACASFMINAANGWIPDDDGGSEPAPKGVANVKRLAALVAPTLDAEKLLYRAKYDDRALLKLCEILHRALESRPDVFQQWIKEG